jgi:SAM-dependent methyltransferase
MTASCNICNGTSFVAAQNNRMSRSRKPPRCNACRSLERHRIARAVVDKIELRETFARYPLLVWGEQSGIPKPWFKSAEVFGVEHADAGLADRADDSIGFIVAANVLHRIPDHRRVLTELVRVMSADGLMLLSYPSPTTRDTTEDWGSANAARGGACRILGRDFESEFASIVPDAIVLRIEEADPVTGDPDWLYLLTKSPFWMRRAFHTEVDARILD